MNLTVIFKSKASDEYYDAISWYEEQRAGLGKEFDAEVAKVLQIIKNTPTRYPLAEKDVREAMLHRFPYTIYFRVRSSRVYILAVFHQARDPIEWKSRI